jgi:OmpR-family two-component system manganese-sensing response regulator
MPNLLLVEDDAPLLDVILAELGEKYTVDTASNGQLGAELLNNNVYDLVVLDWNLPGMSGVDICRKYRSNGGTALILMLTGKKALTDKVAGLDAGADDYLTKPFHLAEFSAKLQALLRRPSRGQDKLAVGPVVLEPNKFRVTLNNTEVRLVRKEFAILELLMRYAGRVFTVEEIIARVWTIDETPSLEVVRSHIMNLRKKLDHFNIVQTVHGVGYKAQASARAEQVD